MPPRPSAVKALLTLVTCVSLVACAQSVELSEVYTLGPDDPAPEAELQPGYAIDTTTPLLLDSRGGATGDPYALTCAQDELVVGLHGRFDATIVALGVICSRMLENGGLASRDERPAIGGSAGETFSSECSPSDAVIGVRGRAGTTLDRIGVRCARVRSWVEMGAHGSIEPSFGGTGGVPFTDECPPGYFLQGALGHAAETVNGVQGLCVPITS